MITLKEFLTVDESNNRYTLPLRFWGMTRYRLIMTFFKSVPFANRLFISSLTKKFYWEIILNYLQKEYGIKFSYFRSHSHSRYTHERAVVTTPTSHISGYGVDLTNGEVAISKAIGEFLERYTSAIPSNAIIPTPGRMSFAEITKQCSTARSFHNFSTEQYCNDSRLQITDSDTFEVIPVEDLVTKNERYYPLQQIFWNHHTHKEKLIADLTTSGCGAGFTISEASLSALYEAIERDAFFCYWLTNTSPDKINLTNTSPDSLVHHYKKLTSDLGYELYILDTTTDTGIFSCLCLIRDKQTNAISITGGADLDPSKAVEDALQESYAMLIMLARKDFLKLPEEYVPFLTRGVSRPERIDFAASGKHYQHYEFLLGGQEKDLPETKHTFKTSEAEIEEVVRMLRDKNHTAIYRYQFNSETLKRLNYHVVRIIIPSLYQLYLREHLAMTESVRLQSFSAFKQQDHVNLNTFPHPFP